MEEKRQSHIWQNEQDRLVFSELVNVFYARELPELATEQEIDKLKRRLLSLPYYIERAALHILDGEVPLKLDSQNACWLANQKKLPSPDARSTFKFFSSHIKIGLVMPVVQLTSGKLSVLLDCVDQVCETRLHTNQLGWFDFYGQSLESTNITILKPSKAAMTAACCGHQWLFGKAISPRVLSLREMLLASMINWKNVRTTKH